MIGQLSVEIRAIIECVCATLALMQRVERAGESNSIIIIMGRILPVFMHLLIHPLLESELLEPS